MLPRPTGPFNLLSVLGPTRLHVYAADVCAMDPGLVVVGPGIGAQNPATATADPHVVHLVDRQSGKVSISFSAPYRYHGSLALESMVKAKLACDRSSGLIWVAYSVLHEIHALDAHGRLLWIVRLSDVEYPDIVETHEGTRVSVREDVEGSERIELISHITLLGRSLLAVQVESYSIADMKKTRHPKASYRTYFLDADTGRGVGAFTAGHQVIGGDRSRAILYREDPFPEYAVVPVQLPQ